MSQAKRAGGNARTTTDAPPRRKGRIRPTPAGKSLPEAVQKTRAVVDALAQLGNDALPRALADFVRARHGIDLTLGELAAIQAELLARAKTGLSTRKSSV